MRNEPLIRSDVQTAVRAAFMLTRGCDCLFFPNGSRHFGACVIHRDGSGYAEAAAIHVDDILPEHRLPSIEAFQRRARLWVAAISAPVLLAALSGCSALMPTGLRIETSHNSHATVGTANCRERCAEDGLTLASALLQWQHKGLLIEAGEGVNLRGRDGGGFYGPREVFTGRVSYTFDFRSHK